MNVEDYEAKIDELKEEVERLQEANYTLREELKGDGNSYQLYGVVHNRLNCFDDKDDFIPVSHIGDNNLRKTIVEIQTGDEELNIKISELVCNLLNLGYF